MRLGYEEWLSASIVNGQGPNAINSTGTNIDGHVELFGFI